MSPIFGLNPFTATVLMLLASAFYEGERNVLPIGPIPFLIAVGLMVAVMILDVLEDR